jgi:hypothetical protein
MGLFVEIEIDRVLVVFFYGCRGRDRSDTILCERYLCLGIGYVLYSSPTGYNWYRFDYRDMVIKGSKEDPIYAL